MKGRLLRCAQNDRSVRDRPPTRVAVILNASEEVVPYPAVSAVVPAYFSVIVTELIVIVSLGVERSGPVVGTSAIASTTSRPDETLPKMV
jgi:hypothetical protein